MTIEERLRSVPWHEIEESLSRFGHARLGPLLTPLECAALIAAYPDDAHFRSRIDMARYRFGVGDYKYFDYPLPETVVQLREHAYPPLSQIANRWMEVLHARERFPETLEAFHQQCRALGQTKPTPLLLHYEAGGYNCLHQDLYGELAFPLQMVCFLSQPARDYTGGEFLLVEQRPRAQSVGEVVLPDQGEAIVFTTRYRPVKGSRGYYRVAMKHGVSRVKSGTRYTLGVIFHEAK
jgi:uncharacterized protein